MNFREEIKIIWEERIKPRITLPNPTGNRVLDANKLRRFLNVNRGRVGSVLSAAAAAGRHDIVNQILSPRTRRNLSRSGGRSVAVGGKKHDSGLEAFFRADQAAGVVSPNLKARPEWFDSRSEEQKDQDNIALVNQQNVQTNRKERKAQRRAELNANAQPTYLRMAKLLGEVRVGLRFDPLRPRRSDPWRPEASTGESKPLSPEETLAARLGIDVKELQKRLGHIGRTGRITNVGRVARDQARDQANG